MSAQKKMIIPHDFPQSSRTSHLPTLLSSTIGQYDLWHHQANKTSALLLFTLFSPGLVCWLPEPQLAILDLRPEDPTFLQHIPQCTETERKRQGTFWFLSNDYILDVNQGERFSKQAKPFLACFDAQSRLGHLRWERLIKQSDIHLFACWCKTPANKLSQRQLVWHKVCQLTSTRAEK